MPKTKDGTIPHGELTFKNFASAQLLLDISTTDRVLHVDSGAVFPDAPAEGEFVLVVEDIHGAKEIMRCTARAGEALTVLRAQEGSAARGFVSGSRVELRYTAGSMDEYFKRIGLDSGHWSVATATNTRKTLQLRRNYTEPNAVPTNLYEGELIVQMATATPLLYVGPQGAVNNGTGVPVLPVVVANTAPANPYNGLIWFDSSDSYRAKVRQGSVWRNVGATGLGIDLSIYATKTYVDQQNNYTRGHLWAPKGTQMVFHQGAAPAGWVQRTDLNDAVLRVVSDSNVGWQGSWQITGLQVAGHNLRTSQMPSHNHGGGGSVSGASAGFWYYLSKGSAASGSVRGDLDMKGTYVAPTYHGVVNNIIFSATQPTQLGGRPDNRYKWFSLGQISGTSTVGTEGGDEAHAHGLTSDSSWRPRSVGMILCTKV